MDNKQIEKLLANDSDNTPAPVVKAALEEVQKRQKEAAVKETIVRLEQASSNTLDAVTRLRNIRKQEKKSKAYLTAVSDAENVYISNGDWAAYNEALEVARQEFCKR